MRRACQISLAAGLTLLLVSCAADRNAQLQHQTQMISRGAFLLSTTNTEPGSFYELGVYTIGKGDTVSKIAGQFQVSTRDLIEINPGLDPSRIMIGQKLRVYERRREQR
jgi:LysM repeat protein